MRYEIPDKIGARIWKQFQAVLDSATDVLELRQLWLNDGSDEGIISTELERRLYEPLLPYGDRKERKIVERLKEMSRRKGWENADAAWLAASQWAKVSGRYYIRNPIPKKDPERNVWRARLESARTAREVDLEWFAQLMLEGLPSPVSDFRMDAKFLLLLPDGNVDRLAQFINVRGERSAIVTMTQEDLHSPVKFRRFCLGKGNYGWGGGEKEIQKLHEDVNRYCAYRMVLKMVSVGWHELRPRKAGAEWVPGLWIAQDVMIGPDGEKIYADQNDIFWYHDKGFFLPEKSTEGDFRQKFPMWHPRVVLPHGSPGDKEKVARATADGAAGAALDPGAREKEAVGVFFAETLRNFFQAVGGYDGWLCVGHALGMAAMPEWFAQYNEQYGLWLHGSQGSGKTKATSWLMHLYGLMIENGFSMVGTTSSATGLLIASSQYSNLPVWCDEYREWLVNDDKKGVLRDAYSRQNQTKYNPGGAMRKILSPFFVSGESTTTDAATASRYAFVQLAVETRKENNEAWFVEHKTEFYLIFRYLLEHRREYVASFFRNLKFWLGHDKLAGLPERARKCYGFSFAGLMAARELMGLVDFKAEADFFTRMIEVASSSSKAVAEDVNTNVFFEQMLACYEDKELDARWFRVEAKWLANAPGTTDQPSWGSYTLWFAPGYVIPAMQKWLSQRRTEMPLKQKDLLLQCSKQAFWAGCAKKRLGDSSATTQAWGIKLDEHALGYRPASNELFRRYLGNMEEGDPRKGPLFELIESLERKEADLRKSQTQADENPNVIARAVFQPGLPAGQQIGGEPV